MTIVEFLMARITEDEAVACAATAGPWHLNDITYPEYLINDDGLAPVAGGRWGGEASIFDSDEDAFHIVRHDPTRVLANCAAKRRLIKIADDATSLDMAVDNEYRVGDRDEVTEPYCGDLILQAMATEYADHPDYDQAWRPVP